jgi:membrane protease YdiL (CAAX protease family)
MSDEIPTVYALKTGNPDQTTDDNNKPWGVFATIGFSVVIFLVFIIAQTLTAFLFTYIQIQDKPDAVLINELITLSSNGLGLAVSHIPGALAASLLVLLFAYTRENLSIKNYLKLNPPDLKQLLFWIAIMLFFAVAMEVVTRTIDRPLPEWMIESYRTAGILPLFWFALVIAAPIFEELLFRGFLLEGLRHSQLGNLGAIIITSVLWAVIHLQYEAFEVISIFLVGLILGYARIKTNSLYTTIIMHAFMNLVATAQVAAIINQ